MLRFDLLPLEFAGPAGPQRLDLALFRAEGLSLLVDSGYPGQAGLIDEGLRRLGHPGIEGLDPVFVTHHDFDHVGSLAALARANPRLLVISSAEEAPYVSGIEKSLRLRQAEAIFDGLPEADKPGARAFQDYLAGVEACSVGLSPRDGEAFGPGRALRLVATPGHMPGHASVWAPELRLLVAGDALVVEDGRLEIANPRYTLDPAAARASVAKIRELGPEKILCCHGGLFPHPVLPALDELLRRIA